MGSARHATLNNKLNKHLEGMRRLSLRFRTNLPCTVPLNILQRCKQLYKARQMNSSTLLVPPMFGFEIHKSLIVILCVNNIQYYPVTPL